VSPRIETRKKTITLVLGGAQSGKSYYAQQLAAGFERVTFIATAQPRDAEMREKIARHRRERPVSWRTVEAPLDLCARIRAQSREADLVLIDCLTVYVSNVMARTKRPRKRRPRNIEHFEHDIDEVCAAIQAANASIVAVSNEVGSGVVPPYRSGRLFRDLLGQMNRKVAELADTVVLMVAGLPVTVKEGATHRARAGIVSANLKASRILEPVNGVGKGH
jgi:adenosylcobinamide kinase / adenosylcobinamide-phosphate guanylyltransferase